MSKQTFVRVPENYPDDVPPGFYRVTSRSTEGARIDYTITPVDGASETYMVDAWDVIPAEIVDSVSFRRAMGFSQRAHRLLANLRSIYEDHPERLSDFIEHSAFELLDDMESEPQED